jgi:hypothetical protein
MTKALQSPPGYAALFKGNRGARPPAQMRAALAVKWEPGCPSRCADHLSWWCDAAKAFV